MSTICLKACYQVVCFSISCIYIYSMCKKKHIHMLCIYIYIYVDICIMHVYIYIYTSLVFFRVFPTRHRSVPTPSPLAAAAGSVAASPWAAAASSPRPAAAVAGRVAGGWW